MIGCGWLSFLAYLSFGFVISMVGINFMYWLNPTISMKKDHEIEKVDDWIVKLCEEIPSMEEKPIGVFRKDSISIVYTEFSGSVRTIMLFVGAVEVELKESEKEYIREKLKYYMNSEITKIEHAKKSLEARKEMERRYR